MSRRTLAIVAGVLVGCTALAIHAASGPPAPGARPSGRSARSVGPDRYRSRMTLTDEQTEALLAFLKDRRPDLRERLVGLREKDPRAYRRLLRTTWWWYLRWKDAPADVQNHAIEEEVSRIQIWKLAGAIRKTENEGERKRLAVQLREAVTRNFQAEQKVREYRLKQLAERLKQLRDELKQRSERQETIIGERVERYLKGEMGPSRHRGPRPTTRSPKTEDPAGES